MRSGGPPKGILEEKEIVLGVIRNENVFRFIHTPSKRWKLRP